MINGNIMLLFDKINYVIINQSEKVRAGEKVEL